MVVSHVGAVRLLKTVTPLGGAVLDDVRQWCSDSEALDDNVLSVGALVPVCCARLDDFNWVVPDCVSDIFLSRWDIEVGLTDLIHDIQVLPDVFSVVSDRAAVVCVAPMDEAVDNALDVVGLHVGQLWFRRVFCR